MEKFNFKILPIAREARGLTQAELTKLIPNLSQGNYSRMEKGLLAVPEDTWHEIAKKLNFLPSFFTHEKPIRDQAEYYYRKRASMPRKLQIKLEATFDILRVWIEGLLQDVDVPEFKLPPIEVKGNNSPEEIARKVRALMGLQRGPIDNLVRAIERHGIMVYFLKNAPEKFDGTTIVTQSGQRIIVINDSLSNDRKRYTIAHEFGHNVMHLPFSPILDPDRDVEREADSFASEFLMPELDIRRDLINFRFSKLGDLKAFWKVSKASLIRRAYDLKHVDKTKYTNMMIELSRAGERKVERNDVNLDSPALLQLITATYINELGYTREELSNIISISSEDFDFFLLGKEPNRAKFKIVI
ncbi:XRE family transcriptional regulator [Salmonirosea aquatica]|uniref:ImmA/IrrE family metallo-endopeptidase n=1 Tax=Salmonirosea aquatica TaxID=2654236 RepID=A0A7C9FSY0_9BACT|nr:ImmA/IrrE family metallo-endopeptidase [Cytophagaceae bacterium SJW1-29]